MTHGQVEKALQSNRWPAGLLIAMAGASDFTNTKQNLHLSMSGKMGGYEKLKRGFKQVWLGMQEGPTDTQ